MNFSILTPDRLVFFTLLLGFVIFQATRRNMQKPNVQPVRAVGFAFIEVIAQAIILLGVLFALNTLALLVLPPGRFLGLIILILTCIIAYRPVKAITTWVEQQL